jgi:hypothetical protein
MLTIRATFRITIKYYTKQTTFSFMICSPVTSKELSLIPGMENYNNYYIDIEGHIWSVKYGRCKRIRQYDKFTSKYKYRVIHLTQGKGKKYTHYVHRLVALAFLPYGSEDWGVEHINGDYTDNRLCNLQWKGKRIKKGEVNANLYLDDKMSDAIKLVHRAAVTKGIPVENTFDFFHKMLDESLSDYINKYGLRKTMYQLENS